MSKLDRQENAGLDSWGNIHLTHTHMSNPAWRPKFASQAQASELARCSFGARRFGSCLASSASLLRCCFASLRSLFWFFHSFFGFFLCLLLCVFGWLVLFLCVSFFCLLAERNTSIAPGCCRPSAAPTAAAPRTSSLARALWGPDPKIHKWW